MRMLSLFFVIMMSSSQALNNGLARTPPMGWLSWGRFMCNTDCFNDPNNCISDYLLREMGRTMVRDGYLDAGYEYLTVDDCWMDFKRDPVTKALLPDPQRFPHGIKNLSDYIHSLGLKFGIYETFGHTTCCGFPGSLGYLEVDAFTFAAWGADYVKLDGCFTDVNILDEGYREFGNYLNKTGRPMVYSCSWPFYQYIQKMEPDYDRIMETCHLWRNYYDISDSWLDIERIIDHYGQSQFSQYAGPGHWNDPDMLMIGGDHLTVNEGKVQMTMWSILAAPLMMSADLRIITPENRATLLNKKVIAVNQDPLGIQGTKQFNKDGIDIWLKPVEPMERGAFSYAIALVNRKVPPGDYVQVYLPLSTLGLSRSSGYLVEDLWQQIDYGILFPDTHIKIQVPPRSAVLLRANIVVTAP